MKPTVSAKTPPVLTWLAIALMTVVGPQGRPPSAIHTDMLWYVVHGLCVPDARLTGMALPCVAVNLRENYAVVAEPTSKKELLLVPTRRIIGIEDPAILEAGAPNYWRQAWDLRPLLFRRVGRQVPRDSLAMAVNAISGRSQEQLHVHLSCVRPDIGRALKALGPGLSERWSMITLAGHPWRARAIEGQDLGDRNPFRLLADLDPSIAAHMGQQAVVVVGAEGPGGGGRFLVISRTADPRAWYTGHAEFLLDEHCKEFGGR